MARGPGYPYINLEEAVRLTRGLYDFAKRAPANLNSVLKEKWGYSPTSSSAVKVVAALKYYGLVDVTAAGDHENARISERAYRILVDTPTSPERKKALLDACLAPKAYKLCWDTWGKDMPDSMRSMLIFTHGFHESTVDGFLTNYRKSVAFAGLLDAGLENKQGSERLDASGNALQVGDFVQWEHDGVLGLPRPLKLVKFAEDGTHAWVEGHSTGLPVTELVKTEAPQDDPNSGVSPPPPPPPAGNRTIGNLPARGFDVPPKAVGMRQEVFSLSEGDVTIQWPERMSQESLEDFNDWLTILKRKIARSVQQGEASAPTAGQKDE